MVQIKNAWYRPHLLTARGFCKNSGQRMAAGRICKEERKNAVAKAGRQVETEGLYMNIHRRPL